MTIGYSLIFLASDSNGIRVPKPDEPLLIAAVAASLVWLLLLAAFTFSTRQPRVVAGPPTQDLGNEPPAVVSLLANSCRVSPDAVPATLLDLAARGYIDIEEYGDAQEIFCRIARNPPSEELEPYAKLVFDHVRSAAVNGVVAAAALTTGTAGKAAAWRSAFDKAVIADARARGLTVDRWSRPMWGSIRSTGIVAALLIIAFSSSIHALEPGIIGTAVVAAFLHDALVKLFGDQMLSPAGREVVVRWLGVREYLRKGDAFRRETPGAVTVWDRYMAYAAAFGLARHAVQALPMGAEDDHHAWSAFGGTWHPVRVVYPRTRIIWGRSPSGAAFTGLVIVAIGCALTWLAWRIRGPSAGGSTVDDFTSWVQTAADIAAAMGILLALWGTITLLIGIMDFGATQTADGVIVRRRAFTENDKVIYFLALDNGKTPKVRAWRVGEDIYRCCDEGSAVRVAFRPRLGYVTHLDVLFRESPGGAVGNDPRPSLAGTGPRPGQG